MEMNKLKKNRKLLVEIGLITIAVFITALIFIVISDLYYTENVYLTSKNEMIDRDLGNVCEGLEKSRWYEWGITYRKEHSDVMDKITRQDMYAQYDDDDFVTAMFDALYENTLDPSTVNPEYQPYLSYDLSLTTSYQLDTQISSNNYSRSYAMQFTNENEAYIIAQGKDGEDQSPNYGTTIVYKASEHSAVKKILEGGLNAKSGYI